MSFWKHSLVFFAFSNVCAWATGDAAGIIAKLKGDVSVQTGRVSRHPQEDEKFFVGDTFITGIDGRVKLRFAEGGPTGKNEVVIGKSSRFRVEKAGSSSAKTVGTKLILEEGSVRSVVRRKYSGKGDDLYQIKTPNAVAGVRGTIFFVDFDPKTQVSTVLTQQGQVSLEMKGIQQIVAAGQILKGSPKEVAKVESFKKDPAAVPDTIREISKDFEEGSDTAFAKQPKAGSGPGETSEESGTGGRPPPPKVGTPSSEKPRQPGPNPGLIPPPGGTLPPPLPPPPTTTTPYLPPLPPPSTTDPTKVKPPATTPPPSTAPPPYTPPPTTSPSS